MAVKAKDVAFKNNQARSEVDNDTRFKKGAYKRFAFRRY